MTPEHLLREPRLVLLCCLAACLTIRSAFLAMGLSCTPVQDQRPMPARASAEPACLLTCRLHIACSPPEAELVWQGHSVFERWFAYSQLVLVSH